MAPPRFELKRLSRRDLVKQMGLAPLLLRPSPLYGMSLLSPPESPPTTAIPPFFDSRFSPHYPVRSPLEDVLRLVEPGTDEYVTERYAFEIARILDQWGQSFCAGDVLSLTPFLDVSMEATSLVPLKEVQLRKGFGVDSVRREPSTVFAAGADHFLRELERWIGPGTTTESSDFQITSLREVGDAPLAVQTEVRLSVVARGSGEDREHRIGTWHIDWTQSSPDTVGSWKVRRFRAGPETRSSTRGPVFVDRTREALGGSPSYEGQMLRGSDYWRTVLDGACGIDVYGNNGVAAGDFNNDGFDDLYVCQPAGLPNRLYRNRGDGTFDDVTDAAGVGVLDNTACALFADFRNCGLQDLLVVCGNGPLLFVNRGDGTFSLKQDAFHFAKPPQGTFTHAAVADYDRDGRLDIYFCVYSYYLGLDQYHYPAPYFDARNGPPNFLLHNEGDGTFVDRTEAAGLSAENDRYSFACAWTESEAGKMPDLYVVNDFGRNNLYLSNGDGTFLASSTKSHTEDVGAGMSACWTDYNDDQRQDLYVANMWSAAGQRVSANASFHEGSSKVVRELYQRHAQGNALYRNEGNGLFSNVTDDAGVAMGGWAWCSDAWDFDHDGYSDLYVTNGYISAVGGHQASSAVSPAGKGRATPSAKGANPDLGSFFWRQVVAKSPDDATPSLAYERGWNALNELIRSDGSWSGYERNVMLANNRDGTFSEVSGAVKLDFLQDGRSFALADLNHDGRLEVVLKNRNAPQLRILHNTLSDLGDSVAFRLRGTKSNRDAIGCVITVEVGDLRQTKSLQSGSGFLAQHSKEMFFGIGRGTQEVRARVRWPTGTIQHFTGLPRNSRIGLVEGEETYVARPFASTSRPLKDARADAAAEIEEPQSRSAETWLLDPLKAPDLSLPDLDGKMQTLESWRGHCLLLHFWSLDSPSCRGDLESLVTPRSSKGNEFGILAVNLDAKERRDQVRTLVVRARLSYPLVFATEEVSGVYNIIFRYLFDRRRNLALPTSFLLDPDGMIVKVYQGPTEMSRLHEDARSIPRSAAERVQRALPFKGTLYQGSFVRNDFTYGVAMFQHGYLDQAATSFEQVVKARPNDAEGYYNLGTLNLRRNRFSEAREYLRRTLELKPDYPEAWNNLGMMAAQEGQAEEAIRSFRQSLQLRPSYATALLNLGNVYRRKQDFTEAKACLLKALSLQPDDPEANYSVGMLYAQQNELRQASSYLERAIKLRPDYSDALNNLGVLFIHEQEYQRAEEQFRTCIRVAPGFDDSYLNLARLFVLLREKEKARAALSDLLQLHPDNKAAKQGMEALETMP